MKIYQCSESIIELWRYLKMIAKTFRMCSFQKLIITTVVLNFVNKGFRINPKCTGNSNCCQNFCSKYRVKYFRSNIAV